jgi:hypothetical protein
MEPHDPQVSGLLELWWKALEELHLEAARVHSGDGDPRQSVALLHVLEQRAHTAFVRLRDSLLSD